MKTDVCFVNLVLNQTSAKGVPQSGLWTPNGLVYDLSFHILYYFTKPESLYPLPGLEFTAEEVALFLTLSARDSCAVSLSIFLVP